MPSIINYNQSGRREWLTDMLFQADERQTVFTSMAKKATPGRGEKSGIPNSLIGTYQAKVLGELKPGGVADGKDVSAFDAGPPREPISFRPEKYRRAPMVGELAAEDDIAGIDSEWAEAIADQMVLHKRDIELELLSQQDSTLAGGAEGGTTGRGMERWVNDGTLAFGELPVPVGARTPTNQIYAGVLGDGVTTGFTEDVAQGLMEARWQNTGDSGKLVGLLGSVVKNRFGFFTKYKPSLANATVIVQTMTDSFTSEQLHGSAVDVYMSDWGGFSLIPVPTLFLTDSSTGFLLDMDQVELRSRYWMREKPLPDLGGGPREEIASFIALIPGDLRSHAKIDITP